MERRKTCGIRLSRKWMQRLSKLSAETNTPVNTLVCLAVKDYCKRKNRRQHMRQLKKGYIAMGSINRCLANEAVFSDEQQFFTYEQFLSESE